jgi:hypothetical protein
MQNLRDQPRPGSFLHKREEPGNEVAQKCRVNDQLSNSVPVTCGVLVLIYINDLPNSLNYATPRMFADDTSVSYASNSAEELQNVINSELESRNKWLITNKLSLIKYCKNRVHDNRISEKNKKFK